MSNAIANRHLLELIEQGIETLDNVRVLNYVFMRELGKNVPACSVNCDLCVYHSHSGINADSRQQGIHTGTQWSPASILQSCIGGSDSTDIQRCIICAVSHKGMAGPPWFNYRTGPASGVCEFRLAVPDATRQCLQCFHITLNMIWWLIDYNDRKDNLMSEDFVRIDTVILPSWKYIYEIPSPFYKEWTKYVEECTKYNLPTNVPDY